MSVVSFPRGQRPKVERKSRSGRVYAIAFDLDTKIAEQILGPNYRGECYRKIEQVLGEHSFTRQQGSLFCGMPDSDAADCILAVQDLDNRVPWFGRVVRDLQMLRVDERSDLMKVLRTDLRFDARDVG